MKKSFLFWGLIIFLVSGFLWFVSIVFNVITLGHFRELSNIFGIIAASSFPVAIILTIGRRIKNKYFMRQKTEK